MESDVLDYRSRRKDNRGLVVSDGRRQGLVVVAEGHLTGAALVAPAETIVQVCPGRQALEADAEVKS